MLFTLAHDFCAYRGLCVCLLAVRCFGNGAQIAFPILAVQPQINLVIEFNLAAGAEFHGG